MKSCAARKARGEAAAAQLVEGNVLIALVSPSHIHHAAAERWIGRDDAPFAS